MPKRTCKVCAHKQVRLINKALANPENKAAEVAREYGINPRTMQRHYSSCIGQVVESIIAQQRETPGEIVPPLTQAELAIGADIVYRVQHLQERTLALLDKIPEGKIGAACAVIREARGNYALIARLTGKLNGSSEEGGVTVTFEQLSLIYKKVVLKEAA